VYRGGNIYTIEVADNVNFNTLIITSPVSDTFLTPMVNLPIGLIFWRVKSDLNATFSSVGQFEIVTDTLPFLISFPGFETINLRPTFSWFSVLNASTYKIEISTQANFNNVFITTPLAGTTYTPAIDLTDGTTYYWRVSSDLDLTIFSPIDSVTITVPLGMVIRIIDGGEQYKAIFPNPSSEGFMINYSGSASISIYDMYGNMIYQGKAENNFISWNKISKAVTAGIYLVQIGENNKLYRVIKR